MIKNLTTSPETDLEALKYSSQLVARIKQEISTQGLMSFARFMELALYSPGLGYYTAGLQKFGKEGDFSTAPEISALYSRSLAKQCQQILTNCPGDILEFGAGTGIMAADILLKLEELQTLPNQYYILERSADLKERQKKLFEERIPHLKDKVRWLDTLAGFKFKGLILANEVIDAFPVHLFRYKQNGLNEIYVNVVANSFIFELGPPSQILKSYVDALAIDFDDDYESECNLFLSGWIKSLNEILDEGVILLIDYGFPRHEYYHADRNKGTLMCHYRHHAHTDPLINVGLQDITAHVDFTAVAEAAVAADMSVAGFTNQANFLIACGMLDELAQQCEKTYFSLASEVKILTSPNEMGELFKVMALTKNFNDPLLGFSLRNMHERL